jgi:hypothetical protein
VYGGFGLSRLYRFQGKAFGCVIGWEWQKKAYSFPAALQNEFSEGL